MPAIPVPINISEPGSGVVETEAGGPVNRLRGGFPPGVGANAAGAPCPAAGGVVLATGAVVPAELEPDEFPGAPGAPDGE